jgi:hypothetical protein
MTESNIAKLATDAEPIKNDTIAQRFETGIRFTDGECKGEVENNAEYYPTWREAYDGTLAQIKRELKIHGETLEGYIYDRMANIGAEECRYFLPDGTVVDIQHREQK